MENRENTVRVKEELNDTWPSAGNDFNFDSVNFDGIKITNVFTFHELGADHSSETVALLEKPDEKLYTEYELKDVKTELESLLTTIRKSDQEIHSPIVKVENLTQLNYSDEKSPMISIDNDFDYYDYCRSHGSHILFEQNSPPQWDVHEKHDRTKPFECELCHKSFGRKQHLKGHIDTVHNQSKLFECSICHKRFGDEDKLNRHKETLHDRYKPYECEICHKSFAYKGVLKNHSIKVHNLSKPFERDLWHIEANHCRSEPREARDSFYDTCTQ